MPRQIYIYNATQKIAGRTHASWYSSPRELTPGTVIPIREGTITIKSLALNYNHPPAPNAPPRPSLPPL